MEATNSLTIASGSAQAQAVMNTICDPMLILDGKLRVVAASRSFFETFLMNPGKVYGRFLHEIGENAWRTELRAWLEGLLQGHETVRVLEVEAGFAGPRRRRMLLNARALSGEDPAHKLILLAMEDVTSCRAAETAMRDLVRQKDIQLKEMRHRIANSLQIVASILLLNARAVRSDEARQHLQDAHQRVMAVAAVQEQLNASKHGDAVAVRPYFERLCRTLADSLITDPRAIVVAVNATDRQVPTSDATSLGLIVTELLINALKHAYPVEAAGGNITVDYRAGAVGWSLDVSDDGVGLPAGSGAAPTSGLGTGIVEALANRLGAQVTTSSDESGTRVSIRRMASSDRISAVA